MLKPELWTLNPELWKQDSEHPEKCINQDEFDRIELQPSTLTQNPWDPAA